VVCYGKDALSFVRVTLQDAEVALMMDFNATCISSRILAHSLQLLNGIELHLTDRRSTHTPLQLLGSPIITDNQRHKSVVIGWKVVRKTLTMQSMKNLHLLQLLQQLTREQQTGSRRTRWM